MNALGLGRLKNLEPKVQVRPYQWQSTGDMIHVDTKQLARFKRVGHRITVDHRPGSSRGAGYEKVHVSRINPLGRRRPTSLSSDMHVAIDDATRFAYVEVLADEQRATTVGFLARAVGWFSEQGISCCRGVLSDHGPATAPVIGEKPFRHWP